MKMSARTVAAGIASGGLILLVAGSAQGQLTGSGSHLAIPSPNPGAPVCAASVLSSIVHPTSFVGTWSTPALSPWIGSFTALGPVPSSANSGTTTYDFTGLAAGELPAGTLFQFGDVDDGSAGNETFRLQAFDSVGTLMTTPWLDAPSNVWGTGAGGAGVFAAGEMPGWSWSAGTYTVDGNTVGGNPTISFVLPSNTAITSLKLVKTDLSYSFGLCAPIPAPGSLAVLGLAGIAARRRRDL